MTLNFCVFIFNDCQQDTKCKMVKKHEIPNANTSALYILFLIKTLHILKLFKMITTKRKRHIDIGIPRITERTASLSWRRIGT